MEEIATALKVMGHPDRLRILAILSYGEFTVSELVHILGLSQPRITQYIKSLEEAGIIERLKEGSWVFSRINRNNAAISALVATTLGSLKVDDPALLSDRRKLEEVREHRAKSADAFFADVANDRGQLGDEYLPQADIEAVIKRLAGNNAFDFMVDLGTGTGRILNLFSDQVKRGTGFDNSADMLKVARYNLSGDSHAHLSLRQGDLRSTPLASASADLVTLHQVLHFLDDPEDAIREAARIMMPEGKLLIIDYIKHDLEVFREKYAHRRLGFSDENLLLWVKTAGLKLRAQEVVRTEEGKPDVCIWLAEKSQTEQQAS